MMDALTPRSTPRRIADLMSPSGHSSPHRFEQMETDSSTSVAPREHKLARALCCLRVCIGSCGFSCFALLLTSVLLGVAAWQGVGRVRDLITEMQEGKNETDLANATADGSSSDSDKELPPCKWLCTQQRGLTGDPGACTPGRDCVFGLGWCREVSHPLPGLRKWGTCRFEAESTTTTTTADVSTACRWLCTQQRGLTGDPGACTPGRQCVFGNGWCREISHPLSGQPVRGVCTFYDGDSTPPPSNETEQCAWLCTQQRGLTGDPGACTPGRKCVYGRGWCREASHALSGQPIKGYCDFGEVTTTTTAPEDGNSTEDEQCKWLCTQQRYGTGDPGACTPGRRCVYGNGWCREASHPLSGQSIVGYCAFGEVTTTTEAAETNSSESEDDQCKWLCTQQRYSTGDPGACTPGRRCVYGNGWCREATHPLSGQSIVGYCAFGTVSTSTSTTTTTTATTLEGQTTTSTPRQYTPCTWLCTQQRWLWFDPQACTSGRKCVYGNGWCRQEDHPLAGQSIKGYCYFGDEATSETTTVATTEVAAADPTTSPASGTTVTVTTTSTSSSSTVTTSTTVTTNTTTTTVGYECPESCLRQRYSTGDPGACTPGRSCVYGPNWCRQEDWPLPGLTITGNCIFPPDTTSTASTTSSTSVSTATTTSSSTLGSGGSDSGAGSNVSSTQVTTTVTTTTTAPCPQSCLSQRYSTGDPQACTPGRDCVYGNGWCRERSHPLAGQSITGYCTFPVDRRLADADVDAEQSLSEVADVEEQPDAAPEEEEEDVYPILRMESEEESPLEGRALEERTYTPNCPHMCQQAGGGGDPGACVPGRKCVYGRGWCRSENYPLPGLPIWGYCSNENCGGPLGHHWPKTQCGASNIASLDVTRIIRALIYAKGMPSAEELNQQIAETLTDFEDVSVQFETPGEHAIDVQIEKLRATWLVGCWPPQRYAVVSATVRMPQTKVHIHAADLDYTIDASSFALHVKDIRVELQCHAGNFVIGDVGTEAGTGAVQEDSFSVSGDIDVDCGSSLLALNPFCTIGKKVFSRHKQELLKELPKQLTKALNEAPWPIPIEDASCPFLFHNTMSSLGYATKECCERPFALDNSGALVGGQFNGQPLNYGQNVSGVTCKIQSYGVWGADCKTVPGGYYEVRRTPGTPCDLSSAR
eukprot:TRINITY_DN1872_c0_g1_i3.p1 TRINITY_DN1872_c0_g1~~TRINITY_DN1872_c0_g1_i3.p1  ORF type:complete len:1156 (+),score=181.99 TRINITY_DN1872_c0_g1_i3:83-3550(+)